MALTRVVKDASAISESKKSALGPACPERRSTPRATSLITVLIDRVDRKRRTATWVGCGLPGAASFCLDSSATSASDGRPAPVMSHRSPLAARIIAGQRISLLAGARPRSGCGSRVRHQPLRDRSRRALRRRDPYGQAPPTRGLPRRRRRPASFQRTDNAIEARVPRSRARAGIPVGSVRASAVSDTANDGGDQTTSIQVIQSEMPSISASSTPRPRRNTVEPGADWTRVIVQAESP